MQIEIEFDQASLMADPILRTAAMQDRLRDHVTHSLAPLRGAFSQVCFRVHPSDAPEIPYICRVVCHGHGLPSHLAVEEDTPVSALLMAVAKLRGRPRAFERPPSPERPGFEHSA